ncbi:MAG: protein phosphatase 2C domain-containing protein [Oscillospiraceae bacterium]|nr:protein phosphatase 2C domain-containing protein [Oscillospiraceae bacterium]
MTCSYTAATSKGGRRENQDNIRVDTIARVDTRRDTARNGTFSDKDTHLFCVCDGIGGEYAGVVASATALDAVNEVLHAASPGAPLEQLALDAAQAAQENVLRYYENSRRPGGTTISMALIRGADYVFLNIGDSPAFHYCAGDGICAEISVRHNLAARKRARGMTVCPGDASYLTAYLGDPRRSAAQMAHTVTGRLSPGDTLLLCSDGVTNAYDFQTLAEAMADGVSAREMVSCAAAQPDSDNCSAIHLLFEDF